MVLVKSSRINISVKVCLSVSYSACSIFVAQMLLARFNEVHTRPRFY